MTYHCKTSNCLQEIKRDWRFKIRGGRETIKVVTFPPPLRPLHIRPQSLSLSVHRSFWQGPTLTGRVINNMFLFLISDPPPPSIFPHKASPFQFISPTHPYRNCCYTAGGSLRESSYVMLSLIVFTVALTF